MNKSVIWGCLLSLCSFSNFANEVLNNVPEHIEPTQRYVFYSHGYIVEGDNPKPVDTRFGWGEYDFPAIKDALSDDTYTLIATHRKKNTDPFEYAKHMSEQIEYMVESGVSPSNIAIVGFSRGAFITGLVSNHLARLGVNTVILAGCGRLISPKHDDIRVYGHVLSIYEESDRANTCDKLQKKSPNAYSFTEIAIDTGLEHGAFYRPIKEWVIPLKDWLSVRFGDS